MELIDFLSEKLNKSDRIVILGVGSLLRSDDAAGVMITDRLIKSFGSKMPSNLKIYTGDTAPENFAGEIRKFRPDHLLVIDAADYQLQPGEVFVIDASKIGGITFSTHMLPLKLMLEYIEKETGCQTTLIGIQPDSIKFGGHISTNVSKAIEQLVRVLKSTLSQTKRYHL